MAHTASARKRHRQNVKRNLRNRSVKHSIKTQIRKVVRALDAKEADAASRELTLAFKRLDKAGARRIMHPKTVARTKSRLASRLAKLKTPAQ